MNSLEKLGLDLYPSIKDRLLNVVLKVDMRKEYKDIFEVDCSFEEFVSLIREDDTTKKIAIDILYEYYGFKKMPIITDITYENWYFVKYYDQVTNKYTFNCFDKISCLNNLCIE